MNWREKIVEYVDYLVNGIVFGVFIYTIIIAFGFLGTFWQ